jgi:asparagine synthase (glutamine-hydrolysing)
MKAETGGYYMLRPDMGSGFAFVRCAQYRHRPGQADMLHVDLWWRGLNIAQDPGTYSYNAPNPWNNVLIGTAFHNTVMVDGQDQMDQVGKFMWLPWISGRVRRIKESSSRFFLYWEGEHDGYRRLQFPASHVRSILKLGDEHWLIVDRIGSKGGHRYRLHWLLSDFPFVFEKEHGSVTLATPKGSYQVVIGSICGKACFSLVRADENSPRGWCSHYYQEKEPALSIGVDIHDRCGLLFSLFGPDGFTSHYRNEVLDITTRKWRCAVSLSMNPTENKNPNISYACVTGQWNERFEIH